MLLGTLGVAALTACGGGGGDGGNVRNADDGAVEVNTLLVSDTLLSYGGVDTRIDLDCHGDTCTMSFQGTSWTFDFDDLLRAPAGHRRPAKPAFRSSRSRTPPMASWAGPKNAPVTVPASPPARWNVLPRTSMP